MLNMNTSDCTKMRLIQLFCLVRSFFFLLQINVKSRNKNLNIKVFPLLIKNIKVNHALTSVCACFSGHVTCYDIKN